MLFFQRGADTCLQQYRVERFRQVVIRSHFDAFDDAVHFIEGGYHDNRDVTEFRAGFQFFQYLESVNARHHDIEQDDIKILLANLPQGFFAIADIGHLTILLLQSAAEQIAVHIIIVNDEDSGLAGVHVYGHSGNNSISVVVLSADWAAK